MTRDTRGMDTAVGTDVKLRAIPGRSQPPTSVGSRANARSWRRNHVNKRTAACAVANLVSFAVRARRTLSSEALMRRSLLLGLSLLALGCDNTDPGPEDDAGGGVDAGHDAPDPFDAGGTVESFTVTFGPVTVAPAEENTQCVIVRLGNPAMLRVGRIHNVLSPGSHHFIVYRTNDTEERATPFDCQPFVETLNPEAGSPLMITQRSDETLTLPDGVAFSLDPNQMVRLEMHYINTGTTSLDVTGTATFTSVPDELFEYEADFLFIGTPDIDLAPRVATTVGPAYFPIPADLADVNFFGITGHTHRFGTNVEVMTTDSEAGAGNMVYSVDDWRWDEPDTVRHDPAFNIPAGGGFRFQCDYQNTSDANVGFGESANEEMCFFWAYYYPSQGSRVCVHTEQAGGVDVCCPGNPTLCDLISRMF